MATVSLCMIVKNEEKVLARCLDSVADCVDEIVIADTGSTDATKEIAAKYTDKIYDFPWIDDFSAARNFSFSKATKDFIMWLDADDVLTEDNRELFLKMKNALSQDVDSVMMPYQTAFDEEGNPVFSYYRERLVRRGSGAVWKGRVHEAMVHVGRRIFSDAAIRHCSVKTFYSDRNLKIYESQIAAGERLEPRDRFYYGRELYYHRRYEEAKRVLKDFLDSKEGWSENNIEACKILSYCFTETNDPDGGVRALTRTFCYDTPRAETCCEIGSIFLKIKNYRLAAFWYELALKIPKEEKFGAFVSEDCYGYLPCIQLCVCYDKLGDRVKAEEYNRRAGTYRPKSRAYLQNLEYFRRLSENH